MDSSNELIRDFVNTLHMDPSGDEEELQTPAALASWLAGRGLLDEPKAGPADLRAAIALREALRQLLLANTGEQVDVGAACTVLNEATKKAKLELQFTQAMPSLEPAAAGVPGALGRIVAAMHAAVTDGSWARLKACRAHDCEWAFIDSAKNASRQWCSMRSCGNREKARQYRKRHAHTTGARAAT